MYSLTVYKGSADGSIKRDVTKKPELKGDEVLVKVTASGLCGTDAHYRSQDMVLGHEGVGVVEATGPGVRQLQTGDRVGWGYEHDSCGLCELCQSGRETFCPSRSMYGFADLDQGSFATGAVWKEPFLFKIPDGLTDVDAAPLMCAGATVFSALTTLEDAPVARVGVIGVGGLGHLAIQFAAKLGCDVAVFSGTDSKRSEAMKLGARSFYATKDSKGLDIGSKKLDILLVTSSMPPEWQLYIPLLSPGATIFPLTISMGDFSIPYQALISMGLRVQGAMVASRVVQKQMLEFAARNNVKPVVETFAMSRGGITEAFEKLANGQMRYRGVLIPKN
ncbi:Putative alcohol dehydrogenase, zinc-type, GroES-like superfamily, NAD(P)-binding domain superfamily [Colletotrichum destructivum]|uniref:Alcohol dehydrogenase, zinc-type, GroES-like superfamily, NAD(P)-binding domain superfamily n=1 Tax=Colletotrichum destructivum TaxID=34406 RepID=A0AAX4I776_9PEZI|nr:Putative alcohol dehydrogenase, zinc-type, GroES-like superfamily, NAD(P)-binding domain superfamily [Colletotrichum destructivum]